MRRDLILGVAAVLVVAASSVFAAHQIRGFVMGSGGETASGTSHTVRHTLGQTVVDEAAGLNHRAGSGFWGASPHVTAVDPEQPPPVPVVDRLHQNHPNPFNPSTTIRFDLSGGGGHVRLKVYDVRGQLVTTLVDATQTPGRKSVIWSGQDDRGQRWPPV